MKKEISEFAEAINNFKKPQDETTGNKSASVMGSSATAETINKKISRILLDAIGGHNKQYRTEDGFIKWGKVEREMHEAVNQELP
jgi:hypothetical protein